MTEIIEPTQRTAARVAGALYLVIMANSLLAEFFLRAPLMVRGDAARTAQNILASERLFRISTVSVLMSVVGNVILLMALYVVLQPINKHVALLAAFFRVAECVLFAVSAASDVVALRLLSGSDYLRAFETEQLQALARALISTRHDVGLIGAVFLGLGSTVFAWLWLKSRYIPRLLAAWGIFASLTLALGILTMMVFPELTSIIGPAYWAPLFIFEVTLGVWLLVKGIRASVVDTVPQSA